MDEITNKFFLAGDKFMKEMHLKQTGFTCSVCRSFTRNKNKINKVHSSFIDNMQDVDLADMQLISKLNKGCRL